jgi:2-oxoglutarate-Fe(II)-dependent oxygenase superfamily protein
VSTLSLNPRLDADALRPVFARFGHLHLPDLLVAADAQRLAEGLKQTPWSRTFQVGGKGYRVTHEHYARTPQEVRDEVERAIAEGGRAADGHVAEAYAPKFNAINIFRVPQWHSVIQVASYVETERLAFTGWIRGAKPA